MSNHLRNRKSQSRWSSSDLLQRTDNDVDRQSRKNNRRSQSTPPVVDIENRNSKVMRNNEYNDNQDNDSDDQHQNLRRSRLSSVIHSPLIRSPRNSLSAGIKFIVGTVRSLPRHKKPSVEPIQERVTNQQKTRKIPPTPVDDDVGVKETGNVGMVEHFIEEAFEEPPKPIPVENSFSIEEAFEEPPKPIPVENSFSIEEGNEEEEEDNPPTNSNTVPNQGEEEEDVENNEDSDDDSFYFSLESEDEEDNLDDMLDRIRATERKKSNLTTKTGSISARNSVGLDDEDDRNSEQFADEGFNGFDEFEDEYYDEDDKESFASGIDFFTNNRQCD